MESCSAWAHLYYILRFTWSIYDQWTRIASPNLDLSLSSDVAWKLSLTIGQKSIPKLVQISSKAQPFNWLKGLMMKKILNYFGIFHFLLNFNLVQSNLSTFKIINSDPGCEFHLVATMEVSSNIMWPTYMLERNDAEDWCYVTIPSG